jgi:hypothetical protein
MEFLVDFFSFSFFFVVNDIIYVNEVEEHFEV